MGAGKLMKSTMHFPGWTAKPLLTMACVDKSAQRVVDSSTKMVEFWRRVLEPCWAHQIAQPVVAVVLLDEQMKALSMVMVGFGTLAEISDALLHQLFPALAGMVNGLVLMSGRGTDDAKPQAEDFAFIRHATGSAGRKITFHDYIVISSRNYFSFQENNWPKSLRSRTALRLHRAPRPHLRVVSAPRSPSQEPFFVIPSLESMAA